MKQWFVALALLLLAACNAPKEATPVTHAVHYFEIPVTDMNRAVRFYGALFEVKLERQTVDGYEMALFPFRDGAPGATGALAKGDVYVPSKNGAILYFQVYDIKLTVDRAVKLGSKQLYPIKDVGDAGKVAEIEDSEGNRIALNQLKG